MQCVCFTAFGRQHSLASSYTRLCFQCCGCFVLQKMLFSCICDDAHCASNSSVPEG